MRSNIKLWRSIAVGGTYTTQQNALDAEIMAFGTGNIDNTFPIWIAIFKKQGMADALSSGQQPYALLLAHPDFNDPDFPEN